MKLGYETIAYLIVLSAYNMISTIVNEKPLIEFILYIAVFLLAIFSISISQYYNKETPVHGVIFTVFAVMCEVIGPFGLAILLFCFSLYLFGKNKKIIVVLIIVITSSIFVRAYTHNYSVIRVFNFAGLHAVCFVLYYRFFHPKPVKLESIHGLTPEQAEILQYLVQGFVPKEIGDKLDVQISANAVYKRVAYMREKHGYRTTEQMIYDLAKNGRLRQLL